MVITKRHSMGAMAVLFVLLAAAVTVVLFGSLFEYLWVTWRVDPFYQHGFVAVGTAFLLYIAHLFHKMKSGVAFFPTASMQKSLLLFVGACFFFISGVYTHLPFLGGVALVFWLWFIHSLLFDHSVNQTIRFPVAYLLLVVPLPYLGELSGLLQVVVAGMSTGILSFVGYGITQQGIQLSLPNATFVIAEACTGIQSWLVLMAVVTLFVYYLPYGKGQKWSLFFLIIPVAFVSNLLRVLSLLLIGAHYGQTVAMSYWHDFAGVVFYLIACVLMLLCMGIVKRYGR